MGHLNRLSHRQRFWLAGTLAVMIGIVVVGWLLRPKTDPSNMPSLTTDMTIRQLVPKLGTTGFALAQVPH